MTRIILSRCSSRFFSFDVSFRLRLKMITCRNWCVICDFVKVVNFARVWIVDSTISSSTSDSFSISLFDCSMLSSIFSIVVDINVFVTTRDIDVVEIETTIDSKITTILRDLLIERLSNNTFIVIVNKFKDSFFHRSFFENITLWCLIIILRSKAHI